jgi:ankyrin repeat protein
MEDAIDWDAAEIIRILIHNGADMNFLMDAARDGRAEATRALLDLGADWKVEGSNGENPATDAGFRGPEIVKLFLDKGADPNAVSTAGHTMLMNAVYASNLSTMKLLIDAGAEVNVRNKQGECALSMAEKRKQEYSVVAPESARSFQPIIDYLVERGAVR